MRVKDMNENVKYKANNADILWVGIGNSESK